MELVQRRNSDSWIAGAINGILTRLGRVEAGGFGLTNPMTAAGDLIVGGTAGAPTALAQGDEGGVLAVVDGTTQYATIELVLDGGHS